MSFATLHVHRFRVCGCTLFVGRRVASLLIGTFIALYLGGALVLAGVTFDDIVREVAPGTDPLIVAARGLLPAGLAYAAVQSFFASGFGADPMPYRPLPIRRCALIALMSLFALLNLWTAVPLAFIGAVGVEATLDGTGVEALRFGLASLGVLAAATYLAPMLRQALSARPFSSVGVGLALAAATGVDALDLGVTVASLVDVSEWLFGGVVRGAVLPIGAASVLFTGALAGYVRSLRRGMIMDRSARALSVGLSSDVLERLARRGPVCREAVLELRLLLRNTQTRWMLVVALMFVVMVAGIGFIPLEVADLREASSMDLVNMTLFPRLFAMGAFAIFYGQNLFSYEGDGIEASMTCPVSARHRVGGKLLFLEAGTIVCFLIPLPLILLSQSPFLIVHTTFFLYNLGVIAPAV